jgi:hypothetical protein
MNSAINYYSAAQRHTDAIREARRNPPLPRPVDEAPVAVSRGLGAILARRLALWPRTPRTATWL